MINKKELVSFNNSSNYPYYKLIYSLNKKNVLQLVKEFRPIIVNKLFGNLKKYNNNYVIIKDDWHTNYELNSITDYFTESVRVKCKFGSYDSPLNYWIKNKKKILKEEQNISKIREIIYKNNRLCNNFRISVALAILQLFKPKKWLDISAGWGDRLLAAIFYKVDLYFSVDPNKELHPFYNEMINTFVPKTKRKNFIILDEGFETVKIPYNDFDIVFSSPPFFDLEKYSTYEKNSLTKFNSEKEWTNNFLMVSLYKSIRHLKVGGHLILYICGSKYTMEQVFKLNKIMKYKGVIYFYDDKPRGMFIWQKI